MIKPAWPHFYGEEDIVFELLRLLFVGRCGEKTQILDHTMFAFQEIAGLLLRNKPASKAREWFFSLLLGSALLPKYLSNCSVKILEVGLNVKQLGRMLTAAQYVVGNLIYQTLCDVEVDGLAGSQMASG